MNLIYGVYFTFYCWKNIDRSGNFLIKLQKELNHFSENNCMYFWATISQNFLERCRFQTGHPRCHVAFTQMHGQQTFVRNSLLECCVMQFKNEWKHLEMSEMNSIYQFYCKTACNIIMQRFLFSLKLLDGNDGNISLAVNHS